MAPRALFAAVSMGVFVSGCSETTALELPPIPAQTRAIIEIRAAEQGEGFRAWAYDRENFQAAELAPLVASKGQPPPVLWLEFFDESLGSFNLEPGALQLMPASACGARPLPPADSVYRLETQGADAELVFVPSPEFSPELHVEGPCPCEPEPEFDLVSIPGFCRPKAAFAGVGSLLLLGRSADGCDTSNLGDGRRVLVDLVRGVVVEDSTTSISAADLFSADGETHYFGEGRGRLFRMRGSAAPELVFQAPQPTDEVRLIRGGPASDDGSLELVLAVNPYRPPDGPKPDEVETVFRFRARDDQAELVSPALPTGLDTRQRLVMVWLGSHRTLLFPEDEASWIDIRDGASVQYPWTSVGAVRVGTVLPGGDALVGTYTGRFQKLVAGATEWKQELGFEPADGTDVSGLIAVDEREDWYYLRSDFIGRRLNGKQCALISSPVRLDEPVQMLVRERMVVMISELADRGGSAIMYRRVVE